MSETQPKPGPSTPIHNAATGGVLRNSKQVLGSSLKVGEVLEYPPGSYDPACLAVVSGVYPDEAGKVKLDLLISTGATESGLDADKFYLLVGRGCEATAEGIRNFAQAYQKRREQAQTKRYNLSTIVSVAMAKPSAGSFRFTWSERRVHDKPAWYSGEDVFQIATEPTYPMDAPYKLTMRLRQGKTCSVGPFRSPDLAKEMANRIWNHMLEAQIDLSAIIDGGHVGIIS